MLIPISLCSQEGSKNVRVLSQTFKLTQAQFTLLNRGLSFIPTKGSQSNIIEQSRWDLQQYHRRIKLQVYFQNKKDGTLTPFTHKSDWSPPLSTLPPDITDLIQADIDYFENNFQPLPIRNNLSQGEIEALKDLKENNNIIVKPADKGSAVVVMDREQYLFEGNRQLTDKKYYCPLKEPIYPETKKLVQPIIQSLLDKKFINKKQYTYLLGKPIPRPRLFYLLPKIHKEPSKWSVPFEIPPGRPIVSDCDSETYYTAQFIDYYINPLSTKHWGYLKDTYHFVNTVKQLQIPPDSILFTMDVDSLYTNIDIDEGIQAIKNIFFKFPDKKRPDKELLQLLEINLRRNDFQFDNKFYLQIKGTAMGKKFAPAYANIFMAEWEASALASCNKKPLYYFRYLDDIWGVWPHSMEEFDQFVLTLNNHNPSITLKSTTSTTSVDFLDTTTYKGVNFQHTNKLDIKAFFKETDTHALLYKTSHHPKHTYRGLLKSQLLRFHRICTHKSDFMAATKTLFKALATRGYARSLRRKALRTFLETRPVDTADILPFVTTYSRPAITLCKKLKENFQQKIIDQGHLHNHRFLAAFRKNKNLQDHLVSAKVRPLVTSKPRGYGDFFKHATWIRSHSNKMVFRTLACGNPHSKNCIYLISCLSCGLQYVGETKNTLLQRFTQHRHNIQRQRDIHTPLVSHFLVHGWSSVRATILQMDPSWNATLRRRAERTWIRKLDTLHPKGLNSK